ncbi:carboxymuconolactone decarboxylase family protein [Yinghuangia seranimata]|uniref:carboxymuconolactone decarboxylase family protein n=1 Tax=Yinghuangia seranimata TaxID=408067 RepID=UPI00248CCAD8|nr:carboxymuconolactone decarboxylase family protein [Yinghuangia seranimata]MDI2132416.1 carboxymuconolactone decarboxylase family protein [Yinghuangia seranimata]
MAFVELVATEGADPEVRAVFAAVEEQYGFVPNILRALANCPDLLQTFVPFWGQVYSSPTIGPRMRALAALGTAKAQDCDYCVAHMTASAVRAGLVGREIQAIGDTIVERNVFPDRESVALELAETLTQDPDSITDDLRDRLRAAFTDPEIVNIVVAIGMYNLTSRFLKALSVEVEDLFDNVGRSSA